MKINGNPCISSGIHSPTKFVNIHQADSPKILQSYSAHLKICKSINNLKSKGFTNPTLMNIGKVIYLILISIRKTLFTFLIVQIDNDTESNLRNFDISV